MSADVSPYISQASRPQDCYKAWGSVKLEEYKAEKKHVNCVKREIFKAFSNIVALKGI